jgi:ATP-dependent Clp protease ATP-binding subunit ClpA
MQSMSAVQSFESISETSVDYERLLSPNSVLTVNAAKQNAAAVGSPEVAPSHLLVALLERPAHGVRLAIQSRGASLNWLRDRALDGIKRTPNLEGPGLPALLAAAAEHAGRSGKAQVDDLCLFRAVIGQGDSLSDRLLLEAGIRSLPPELLGWCHCTGRSRSNRSGG